MKKFNKISLIGALGGSMFIADNVFNIGNNQVNALTQETSDRLRAQRIAGAMAPTIKLLLLDDQELAVDDSYTAQRNTLFTVDAAEGVLANDNAQASPTLSLQQDVDNGSLTLNPDGSFEYLPDIDFTGTDFFTYSLTTTNGQSDDATVSIRVNGTPEAFDDDYLLDTNAPFQDNVIINVVGGSDTILDDAQVDEVINAPTALGGTVSIQPNGDFQYTPPVNLGTQRDSFVYTLRDNDEETDTATITWQVGVSFGGLDLPFTVAENQTLVAQFSINAPNGLQSLEVNGTLFTLAQLNSASTSALTVNGEQFGEFAITGFNVLTGVLNFSYDPTGIAQDHSSAISDALRDIIAIRATDSDIATPFDAQLTIDVTDTAPVANNDARSIFEGTSAIAGNTVGIAGSATGDVADILIDPTATPVIDVDFGAIDGVPGSNLTGNFGTFVISNTGVYTYTLDNALPAVQGLKAGESVTDVFTYTIADGDSDTAVANVSVTINGVEDATPTITVTDQNGGAAGQQSVTEGSGDSVNGTVAVSATAGVKTLTVSDQEVSDASSSAVTITGSDGSLEVTGFNAATGVLSYTYTEDGAADDHRTAAVTDQFAIAVTDNEDDTDSDTLAITIDDTQPTGVADTNSVTEDAASNTATGNLLSNDTTGADTPLSVTGIEFHSVVQTLGSAFSTDYGSLTVLAGGGYTYTLDNTNATVDGLGDSDTLTETVTYTLADADGSPSTAQLSITINGVNDAPSISANSIGFIASLTPDFGTGNETSAHIGIGAGSNDVFIIGDGGHVVFGDPSGGGGARSVSSQDGASGGGGTFPSGIRGYDTLITGGNDDVIFGDGSGGGGGSGDNGSFDGRGGQAGFGSDIIDSGNGNDIVFADGFAGQNATEFDGGDGGYGGGGGGAGFDNGGDGGFGGGGGAGDGISSQVGAGGFGAGSGDSENGAIFAGGAGGLGNLGGDGDPSAPNISGGGGVGIGSDGGGTNFPVARTGFTPSFVDFDDALLAGAHPSVLNDITNRIPAIFAPNTVGTHGGSGQPRLGNGDDVINGGGGSDHLFGMGGANRFVFDLAEAGAADVDTIHDWDIGTDNAIELRDNGVLLGAEVVATMISAAGSTGDYGFTDGAGKQVTIQVRNLDGSPAVLSASDFATSSINETGSGLSTSGRIFVADSDLGQTVSVAVSSVSESGTISDVDNTTLLSFLSIPATPVLDNTQTGSQFVYTFDTGSEAFVYLKGGESLVLTYTLTATDSGGISSTTTLDITINGVENAAPTLTIADSDGATTPADNSVTEATFSSITGTATVTVDTDIAELSVNGIDITTASASNVIVAGSEGTLAITGFDFSTGVINYRFTEDGNAESHNAANDNINDAFTITLVDAEGDSVTEVLDIRILDTAPTAAADTASVTEDAVPSVVTGDVITNDTSGADTAVSVVGVDFEGSQTVGTPFSSDYGTLDLNSDGTYTYTLDNGNNTVQSLDAGQSLAETFNYTIADTDGDTSSTTLTVTINGADEPPSISIPDVNGAGVLGDASVQENLTSSGSFTATSTSGLSAASALQVRDEQSDTLNLSLTQLQTLGTANQTLVGTDGTLTLNGYTNAGSNHTIAFLFDPTGSSRDHSGGDIVEMFSITATDTSNRTSAAEVLDILITDTNPVANNDARSMSEGTSAIAGNAVGIPGSATGDVQDTIIDVNATPVTDVDFGATDGTVGSSLEGDFGSFVISSVGVYTYTLDNASTDIQGLSAGESVTDVFTYTITDGDGDTDTANVTVTVFGVEDAAPTITVADANGVAAGDMNVAEGSGVTVNGTATITASAGVKTLTVGGQDVTNASSTAVTITGTDGSLEVTAFNSSTGLLNYNYTENSTPNDHTAGAITDQFSIAVSDFEDDSASDTLVVSIDDTDATAVADTGIVTEDAVPNVITGNVFDNDTGADSKTVTQLDFSGGSQTIGSQFTTVYGDFLILNDGSYTYTLDNTDSDTNALITGETPVEIFTYILTDTDGDASTSTVSITINGVDG